MDALRSCVLWIVEHPVSHHIEAICRSFHPTPSVADPVWVDRIMFRAAHQTATSGYTLQLKTNYFEACPGKTN